MSRPSIVTPPSIGQEAADGVHQRRLAGAVGADQPDHLAGAAPRGRRRPRSVGRRGARPSTGPRVTRPDRRHGAPPSVGSQPNRSRPVADGRDAEHPSSPDEEHADHRSRGPGRTGAPARRERTARARGVRAPLVRSGSELLPGSSAGMPTTQRAPSTAPPTDARPPITPIDTSRSDSAPENRSGVNVTRSPASSAPLSAGQPTRDGEGGQLRAWGDSRTTPPTARSSARR